MLVYGECECFVMQMLYVCVHPVAVLNAALWSPHLVKHIDQLEKIQRSFTKHITFFWLFNLALGQSGHTQ